MHWVMIDSDGLISGLSNGRLAPINGTAGGLAFFMARFAKLVLFSVVLNTLVMAVAGVNGGCLFIQAYQTSPQPHR